MAIRRKKADGTIEATVKRVIEETLGVDVDEITPSASLVDDLGADSLDAVEIIMELEERFDLQIPDEDAVDLVTVAKILAYLEGKVPQPAS